MAPTQPRLLLTWGLPTVAVLLSYFWFRRKRIGDRSDPGGTDQQDFSRNTDIKEDTLIETSDEMLKSEPINIEPKKFSRSLSGVESAPIDIIVPKDMRSLKTTPVHVSDEDLDAQIEKVKPPKNSIDNYKLTKELVQKASVSPVKTSPKSQVIQNNNNNVTNGLKKKAKGKKQVNKKNLINNENSMGKVNGADIIPETETVSKKITEQKTGTKKSKAKKQEEQQQDTKKTEEKKKTVTPSSSFNVDCPEFVPKSFESLKLTQASEQKTEESATSAHVERQRSISTERDSANHSPVEQLIASPSLSNISDQESLDSGKGGSGSEIIGSPVQKDAPKSQPQEINNIEAHVTVETQIAECSSFDESQIQEVMPLPTIYDFLVPKDIVGKFIGKGGYAIKDLKEKSNTNIFIRAHPNNKDYKVCVIEGYQPNIESALKLIREKFPLKKFPNITLEQSFLAIPPNYNVSTDCLYLRLIQGINNDIVVSCGVDPNYFFVQQYTHPTYLATQNMVHIMTEEYNNIESPLVPFPAPETSVCCGFSGNQWFRVLILGNDTESEMAYVTFLDFGGYAWLDYKNLRQMRADFLTLPFQAQGCILHGVKPIEGDEWSKEAHDLFTNMTLGKSCITQVVATTQFDEPIVSIFTRHNLEEWVCISDELVKRGLAVYAEIEEHDKPMWLVALERARLELPSAQETVEEQPQSEQEETPTSETAGDVTAN